MIKTVIIRQALRRTLLWVNEAPCKTSFVYININDSDFYLSCNLWLHAKKGGSMVRLDMKQTGKRIEYYMHANTLTVYDLADACLCTHQAVYKWLSGKAIPQADNLVILAELFGVSVDEILVKK